ncbi:MarR family transcriptional regulator/GNAT family N-acetyltransferase [Pseudoxanthomonas sp. CAU 1598]|uniref:MarR family transcriptional regulator/GNAT family N-acetyltransferase n=2 Tax=Pseudomarimonas arenosa TaxID=2774145 RepID=A0AAW3ZR19_9GAMM|nr:MarR family transcriptional regulator/GNAT family N-acetyltransferase [Pseudomarimonas arenosa]
MEFVNQLGLLALGSRLRALSDRLYAIADQIYAGAGLKLQGRWFPLLRLLHDRGSANVGEIAEAIGQTHSAVSQLANKLVREGWLLSRSLPGDRRQRRLQLSAKAEQELRAAKLIWRAIEQHLAEACAATELDVLGTLQGLDGILSGPIIEAVSERAHRMRAEAVEIVPFRDDLQPHFYRLNADWLRKFFYLEEIDHFVLSNPQAAILADGGAILFARLGEQIVGTCALKHEGKGVYELTKMGVDEVCQGLGIGRRLIDGIVDEFRRRKGKTLFLETNSKLSPAIRLYESVGFEHQPTRKPDSHYQRSDVYMIWRDRENAPRPRRKSSAARE